MTNTWIGGTSTDSTIDSNWSSGSVPVTGEDVIFDGNATKNCIINSATFPEDGGDLASLVISSDFKDHVIQTGTNTEINLEGVLSINKPACIDADHTLIFDFNAAPSTTVYDSGGSSYTVKPFVIFGSSLTASAFVDSESRTSTTFDFGSQNFVMVDGVYPNITGTGTLYAKSIYSDASRTLHNSYGSVDILAVNGLNVNSTAFDIYDYDKVFNFEGALTALGTNFRFGHTTAAFKATGEDVKLPVMGEINSGAWGTNQNFYVQYHKVIIKNAGTTNYFRMAGRVLECNELFIQDGGRLYGPSDGTQAATIKSIKRPTIHGDWNFSQVADGVYKSITDISNLDVAHGGTGLQTLGSGSILYGQGMQSVGLLSLGSAGQVLKVNSGATAPEWSSTGVQQFIIFGEEADLYSGTGSTGNANGYQFSYGNGRTNVDQSSTGTDFGIIIPVACTLTRVDISFGNSGNLSSGTTTFVVVKNEVNQTGNLSTSHSAGRFQGNHTGLSYSFSAGDRFNIRTTTTSQQVGPMRMTATFTL